jgi:hypothetical protein
MEGIMGNPIYVKLDEEAFRALVQGREARVSSQSGAEVRLILADIGWGRMLAAITDAENEAR